MFFVLLLWSGCLAAGPLVVNTWPFVHATSAAWQTLKTGGSRIDAVEKGCTQCEIEQCDGSVGYGGSPDENGETTLDALIFDPVTYNAGSVGDLRRIKNAIGVARAVMEHTSHTLLAGAQATEFAKENGFLEESLETPASRKLWEDWKKNNCQPNYRVNVLPNASASCGPYKPNKTASALEIDEGDHPGVSRRSHDTIAMLVMDGKGDFAVGTTTNGANHKLPGRVGDSPILGAGAYADNAVGACGATGDGDVMMRFLPCFLVVELMKQGATPTAACEEAIGRVAKYFPKYLGALVAVNKNGVMGAAAHGWTFWYSYINSTANGVPQLVKVPPKF